MSDIPSGPGERPKSSWVACHENDGRVSEALVFTAEPRLTGADQGSLALSRVAAQMSWPPSVPVRFDERTTSSPSLRTFGWMSFAAGSLSALTTTAGPNAPATFTLMNTSPETAAGRVLREK